jgi:hypothetical protein
MPVTGRQYSVHPVTRPVGCGGGVGVGGGAGLDARQSRWDSGQDMVCLQAPHLGLQSNGAFGPRHFHWAFLTRSSGCILLQALAAGCSEPALSSREIKSVLYSPALAHKVDAPSTEHTPPTGPAAKTKQLMP